DAVTQLVAQAALRTGAKYIDLYPEFCPEPYNQTGCRFTAEGELLFIDYHHLSTLGSRAVPWIRFRID
ncbi:MAG: hypothetical protein K2Q01_03205, partial [Rickettsiales bacterium]|nr:hypothetical protein [Rickettsiales bacterium]